MAPYNISMSKALVFILLFSSSTLLGQEMIDRISPSVILEQKITECTEWHGDEKGTSVYFNSQGLPSYFHFPSDVVDTNFNIISGNFGKREFFYDDIGNLIETRMSCFEPIADSSVVLSSIKYYYEADLLVKREHYDSPKSVPMVTKYLYNDTLLMSEIRTKPDSSLIVSTGEKFKVESVEYKYDDSNRLISILNYRESRKLDSTSITYDNLNKTWTTFNNQEGEKSVVKMIYDDQGRETERIHPEKSITKWSYAENGLLNFTQYDYLKSGNTRKTVFKYSYK